jgi:hypothetical protein
MKGKRSKTSAAAAATISTLTWKKIPGAKALQKKLQKVKSNEKSFGMVYARTSSLGKKVKGSRKRQVEQAVDAAASQGLKVHSAIAEVISGCLKFDERETLKSVLERKLPDMPKDKAKTVHLFVESVRALARNSMVAEQVYQVSKDNNIVVIPKDYPALFAHNQTPTENFVRKLVCALQELDRDTLVWRLQEGRKQKMKVTTRQNQKGQPKVNGAKTYVEELAPSKAMQNKIIALGKKRDAGVFGWRPFAEKISDMLQLDQPLSHETARRMYRELLNKRKKGNKS